MRPARLLRPIDIRYSQVLFVYNAIDDFVMTNLKTYAGRAIKTAEAEDIDLGDGAGEQKDNEGAEGSDASRVSLSTEEAEDLCSWFKESALPDKVMNTRCEGKVAITRRALIVWVTYALACLAVHTFLVRTAAE